MRAKPPSHPRLRLRGTPSGGLRLEEPKTVALVYAPTPEIARWVESELSRDGMVLQVARTVTHLFAALTEDPSSRPHFIVVDLDAISAVDLMQLHAIREKGWFGALVALGQVPATLRASLAIDVAVAPPFSKDQLRDGVAGLRTPIATVRMPVIRDAK